MRPEGVSGAGSRIPARSRYSRGLGQIARDVERVSVRSGVGKGDRDGGVGVFDPDCVEVPPVEGGGVGVRELGAV